MMSASAIQEIADEAGRDARIMGTQPYHLDGLEQIDEWPPYPFPFLGSAADDVDKDHERVADLFCDSSGFGSPGEPALTEDQLKSRVTDLLLVHGPLLLAVTEQGQFQVYVAAWRA